MNPFHTCVIVGFATLIKTIYTSVEIIFLEKI